MITVTELAARAGCTRGYVKAEIRRGWLAAVKIGSQYVIADDEAARWLALPRRGSRRKAKELQST